MPTLSTTISRLTKNSPLLLLFPHLIVYASSTLKHLFIRLILLILWSGGMLLLTQCNKDEAPLESYRSELLMVHTTSHGDIDKLLTDKGQVLLPTNSLRGVRPDTTYRALATFRYVTDSKRVELRQVVLIPTALPISIKEEAMRTAPIQLLSLWKTPNYINLRFGIPKTFQRKSYHRGGHFAE